MKPMSKRCLKALKLSRDHWVRLETGKQGKGEGIHCENCALCRLYMSPNNGCSPVCPIKAHTKQNFCKGSPWQDALRAKFNLGLSSPQFKAAAKKEREFLESLLPKGEK